MPRFEPTIKTPTYSDLRDELSNWTDEDRIEHIRHLGQLAAMALRQWTGEKGVYSKLFDRHTTIRTDANWLFFNIEGLSSDPRLETAMSMLIAQVDVGEGVGEIRATVDHSPR